MADSHVSDGAQAAEHHGPSHAAYINVFVALAVATALSFAVNRLFPPPNLTGAGLILVVAVVKAFLVGLIFMHLKYDWPRLYFLIFPVFILATMMMVVLLPDMVIAWHREADLDPPAARVAKPH